MLFLNPHTSILSTIRKEFDPVDGNTIIGLIPVGVMGAIWWDIRSIRSETKKAQTSTQEAVDRLVNFYHTCQASLPEKYASNVDVSHLRDRVDEHGNRISKLEGAREIGG